MQSSTFNERVVSIDAPEVAPFTKFASMVGETDKGEMAAINWIGCACPLPWSETTELGRYESTMPSEEEEKVR